MSIMRDDPDFGKRISKKVQEIKEDKANLLCAADDYGKRYQQEILEGTEKRALLLTEGAAKGLSEEDIMAQYGRFVPTVYTPILNLLYFLLRESEGGDRNLYERRDRINEQLIKSHQVDHSNDETTMEDVDALLDELRQKDYDETRSSPKRQEINQQFQKEKLSRTQEEAVKLKDTPDMVNYLYGNITLDTFNLIKKLKALSKSPNEKEAFLAYRKANDLCKKYNLDFDRVPCYVKTPEVESWT